MEAPKKLQRISAWNYRDMDLLFLPSMSPNWVGMRPGRRGCRCESRLRVSVVKMGYAPFERDGESKERRRPRGPQRRRQRRPSERRSKPYRSTREIGDGDRGSAVKEPSAKIERRAFDLLAQWKRKRYNPSEKEAMRLVTEVEKTGKPNEVMQVISFVEARGIPIDAKMYLSLLNCYVNRGDLRGSVRALWNMREADVPRVALHYNYIISSLARAGNADDMARVKRMMIADGYRPDAYTYTALISGYGKANLPDEAQEAFEDMESEGFTATVVPFGALINAYMLRLDVDNVMKTFHRMEASGIHPNHAIFNAIIETKIKIGDMDGARDELDHMRARNLTPDVTTYTTLIDGFCHRRSLPDALQVFQEMLLLGIEPSIETYAPILATYAKDGNVKKAEALMEDVMLRGLEPGKLLYERLVDAYVAAGDTGGAVSVIEEMQNQNIPPDPLMYKSIIDQYNKEFLLKNIGMSNDDVDMSFLENATEMPNFNPPEPKFSPALITEITNIADSEVRATADIAWAKRIISATDFKPVPVFSPEVLPDEKEWWEKDIYIDEDDLKKFHEGDDADEDRLAFAMEDRSGEPGFERRDEDEDDLIGDIFDELDDEGFEDDEEDEELIDDEEEEDEDNENDDEDDDDFGTETVRTEVASNGQKESGSEDLDRFWADDGDEFDAQGDDEEDGGEIGIADKKDSLFRKSEADIDEVDIDEVVDDEEGIDDDEGDDDEFEDSFDEYNEDDELDDDDNDGGDYAYASEVQMSVVATRRNGFREGDRKHKELSFDDGVADKPLDSFCKREIIGAEKDTDDNECVAFKTKGSQRSATEKKDGEGITKAEKEEEETSMESDGINEINREHMRAIDFDGDPHAKEAESSRDKEDDRATKLLNTVGIVPGDGAEIAEEIEGKWKAGEAEEAEEVDAARATVEVVDEEFDRSLDKLDSLMWKEDEEWREKTPYEYDEEESVFDVDSDDDDDDGGGGAIFEDDDDDFDVTEEDLDEYLRLSAEDLDRVLLEDESGEYVGKKDSTPNPTWEEDSDHAKFFAHRTSTRLSDAEIADLVRRSNNFESKGNEEGVPRERDCDERDREEVELFAKESGWDEYKMDSMEDFLFRDFTSTEYNDSDGEDSEKPSK